MNRFTEATRNLLQRRRSLTAGVVAALGLLLIVVSIASASPPSGVTPTILARGSYDAFKEVMDGRPGFVIAPWCGSEGCEAQIKAETQATIRNIPIDGAAATGGCIRCGSHPAVEAWFAKAY